MTTDTAPRDKDKPPIDYLVRPENKLLEAQVHILDPSRNGLLGAHSLRCVMVTDCGDLLGPDTEEVVERLAQLKGNPVPDVAMPLWIDFYRYRMLEIKDANKPPFHEIVRRNVGNMAVHVGFNQFQPVSELMAQYTLPPTLRLWLDFYRLDRSRNSIGYHQHPVPDELFDLAKQHAIGDGMKKFQQEQRRRGSDQKHDSITSIARYTQSILEKAAVENPDIIHKSPFWQEIQAKTQAILDKNGSAS